MTKYVEPGTTFEVSFTLPTGQTVGVQIIDTPTGTVVTPRSTANVVEQPAGSGYYTATRTAPTTEGTYTAFADTGSITPSTSEGVELAVVGSLLTLSVPQSFKDRLSRLVDAPSAPILSSGDLDELLLLGARPDEDGVLPTETGWDPTFDLNAAAAEGWHWKAARLAGNYNFALDGQSVSRAQAFQHCLEMANRFRNRTFGSIPLSTGITRWDRVSASL